MTETLNKAISRLTLEWDNQLNSPFGPVSDLNGNGAQIAWEVNDNTQPSYVNKLYQAQIEVVRFSPAIVITLDDGSLRDFFGNALSFSVIRFLLFDVQVDPNNAAGEIEITSTLTIGGSAISFAVGPPFTVGFSSPTIPGLASFAAPPNTITFSPSGGSALVNVAILGT
jgi:hypothetical protein